MNLKYLVFFGLVIISNFINTEGYSKYQRMQRPSFNHAGKKFKQNAMKLLYKLIYSAFVSSDPASIEKNSRFVNQH